MKRILAGTVAAFAVTSAFGQGFTVNRNRTPATRHIVEFNSQGRMLKGFLFKPYGKGPFPVMLWNHGSEEKPGDQPELAKFYNDNGYIFFLPHRHGQGESPGPYIVDLQEAYKKKEASWDKRGAYYVKLQEEYNLDVVAAVTFLKNQNYVDSKRLFMSGCSFGGMQTLLAAERGLGLKGAVPFAPSAMSWDIPALVDRMTKAVRNAKTPLFLIQARNDYSIGPSKVLGPIIEAKADPNRAKLYPNYGPADDPTWGHGKFATQTAATKIWGGDVMAFFRAAMK